MAPFRRLVPWSAILAVAPVLVAGCSSPSGHGQAFSASAQRRSPSDGAARLVRVVDGDTIRVSIRGRQEAVRLIGIDTPESVKPNTPVQCFALEASARTKAILPPGTPLRLVVDAEARDRYGRLLAYVYRSGDGLFVNLALVREGYAVEYTLAPNLAHVDEVAAAAAQARRAGLGLWGKCAGGQIPSHPPHYRA